MLGRLRNVIILSALILTMGCEHDALNDPYPADNEKANTLYAAFTQRPKHLDPAVSYSSDEWLFINHIYEPPLQYQYLVRPYALTTLTAQEMPQVSYYDKAGQLLPSNAPIDQIKTSVYHIKIKPGIYYQTHPAFAQNEAKTDYLYHHLTTEQAKNKHSLKDFAHTATRELVAEDFVYQIKRLADPTLNSPVLGLLSNYIVGLNTLTKTLQKQYQQQKPNPYIDLRTVPLEGVKVIDKYSYEVTISGKYPQFLYWLAMPFFAPMPWEAAKFYAQPVLKQQNISLDWYPIGTGPYVLTTNNPNAKMVLERNKNFHGELYPDVGEPQDEKEGLLKLKGKPLPFIDKITFTLERESIPYWNKFLQGYYDQSNVTSDNFDQAIKTSFSGEIGISDELSQKGMRLSTSVQPTDMYWGFNMLDEVVGGLTEKKRKLRQAISIAMDIEEYVNIFLNGNAIVAQSPIPPSIFGNIPGSAGVNKQVYDIDPKTGTVKRKSLSEAKKILSEAGYPDGIDPKTKQPLILYYDAVVSGSPESQAELSWIRKQFKKLNIELIVRPTQYNRFQDKVRNGDVQIFYWGWNADYPDPENFLFLLYGPNSRVKDGGENTVNYVNTQYDALFEKMKSMENTPEREKYIQQMIDIVQKDAPWVWGFHPQNYALRQNWVAPYKTNAMSRNTLKYMSIDPQQRAKSRTAWNHAIVWPLICGFGILILLCIPAVILFFRKNYEGLKLKSPRPLREQ